MKTTRDSLARAERLVRCDRADMLYGHASGGLVMTALTATFTVLMVVTPPDLVGLCAWLAAVYGVLALRALDIFRWQPRRRRRGADGQTDIRYFGAGVLAGVAVWAVFPVLFFPVLTQSRTAAAFVVMAAMAGGSPAVLGASFPLAVAFCSAQLLVPGAVFFLLPGRENTLLGLLSLAMYVMMLGATRMSNRSVMRAVRLNRLNEALVAQADWQRVGMEATNGQLATAQVALADANHTLEQRIEERTADLAIEMGRRQRYADALATLASTDPLTGLCNRSSFTERLSTMLQDASAAGTHIAVLFLDIDNFKQVNDVRGHRAGDDLLRAASRVLQQAVGAGGQLARWGGDEFVCALPATGRLAAAESAEALRNAVLCSARAGLDAIRLDASVGIALFPDDGQTQDELIRAADVAMYEAKKQGKGRIRQFDPALAQELAWRHTLEQAMRGAVERGEFSLVFQPIFESRTGDCHAAEALLRWHHPEHGAIDPGLAIQVAEQTSQIGSIGRWVLIEACRTAASWPSPAPAVSVNVSVAQALSGTLADDVADALALSGLPAERLLLEITESMFVRDHVRIGAVFEDLRRLGHQILLDDFGTGFSSLAYLGRLPLDVIKIDQTFVQAADKDSYAIIRAILSIARALSLRVTAEGVETEAQRDALVALGVENLQGYLLARPMSAAAFAAWLPHPCPVQTIVEERVAAE